MKKGILIHASSMTCPDMLYASGFKCIDPFTYLETGGFKAVIVSQMEYGRAAREAAAGVSVVEAGSLTESRDPRRIVRAALSRHRADLWEVPCGFPYYMAEYLVSKGFQLKCRRNPFLPAREIKTPVQLADITESLRLAEKGMRKAVDEIAAAKVDAKGRLLAGKEPVTSERIKQLINVEIVRGGGTASQTIVAGGRSGADPHDTGSGPLSAGTPIVIDIFPRMESHCYWGDITRTVLKGRAPRMIMNAYRAVKEARDSSKELITDGADPGDSYRKAFAVLERHGFKTGRKDGASFGFFHSLGHGIGLDIHEAPRLYPSKKARLKSGSVVTVEPGLYYPEWGGIRLEDVVVVQEEGGPRTITEFPDFLEIE